MNLLNQLNLHLRHLFLISCLALLLFLLNCSPKSPITALPADQFERYAQVHLQSGFDGKLVKATYNRRLVYQGHPTENELLGFSDDFSFGLGPETSGVLALSFSGGTVGEFETIWSKGLTIAISVHEGQLHFSHPGIFGYD